MGRAFLAGTAGKAIVMALAVAGFAGAALARPVVPAERRYWSYDGDVPACNDTGVLDRIKDRFSQKEGEYWDTSLEIVQFDRVRLVAVNPWGNDHIPRTFCAARVLLNDKSFHDVSYSVAEDQGMIGFGFGVEWCVQGLDRNLAFAPNCQLAKP